MHELIPALLATVGPAVPLALFAWLCQPMGLAKHRHVGRVRRRRALAKVHVDRELGVLPRYWFGSAEPAWTARPAGAAS